MARITKKRDGAEMEELFQKFKEENINFIIIQRMIQDFPALKQQVKQWLNENP